MREDWHASESPVGWLVARGADENRCEIGLDQYGRVRFVAYGPAGNPGNKSLFKEICAVVGAVRERASPCRFGGKFSETRAYLCDVVAADLNKRGVSPLKPLSDTHQPEQG